MRFKQAADDLGATAPIGNDDDEQWLADSPTRAGESTLQAWFEDNPNEGEVIINSDQGMFEVNRPDESGQAVVFPIETEPQRGEPQTQVLDTWIGTLGGWEVWDGTKKQARLHLAIKQASDMDGLAALEQEIAMHEQEGENLRSEVGDMAEDTARMTDVFTGGDVLAVRGGTYHGRLKRLADADIPIYVEEDEWNEPPEFQVGDTVTPVDNPFVNYSHPGRVESVGPEGVAVKWQWDAPYVPAEVYPPEKLRLLTKISAKSEEDIKSRPEGYKITRHDEEEDDEPEIEDRPEGYKITPKKKKSSKEGEDNDSVYSSELRAIEVKKGEDVLTPNGPGTVDSLDWGEGPAEYAMVRLESGELRPYNINRLQKTSAADEDCPKCPDCDKPTGPGRKCPMCGNVVSRKQQPSTRIDRPAAGGSKTAGWGSNVLQKGDKVRSDIGDREGTVLNVLEGGEVFVRFEDAEGLSDERFPSVQLTKISHLKRAAIAPGQRVQTKDREKWKGTVAPEASRNGPGWILVDWDNGKSWDEREDRVDVIDSGWELDAMRTTARQIFKNGDVVTVKIQYGKRGVVMYPDPYGNYLVAWENGQQQHVNPELLQRVAMTKKQASMFRAKIAEGIEDDLGDMEELPDDEGGALEDLDQLDREDDDDLAAGLEGGETIVMIGDVDEIGDLLQDVFDNVDDTPGEMAEIDVGMSGEDFGEELDFDDDEAMMA